MILSRSITFEVLSFDNGLLGFAIGYSRRQRYLSLMGAINLLD
jgi:hypothetical protein